MGRNERYPKLQPSPPRPPFLGRLCQCLLFSTNGLLGRLTTWFQPCRSVLIRTRARAGSFAIALFSRLFRAASAANPRLAAPARMDAVFLNPMRVPLGGEKALVRTPNSDPDSRAPDGDFAGSRSRHSRRRNDLMSNQTCSQSVSASWPGIG